MSAVLLLDIGNTRGKWLLLNDGQEQSRGAGELTGIVGKLRGRLDGARALVASVAADEVNLALERQLRESGCSAWFARAHRQLGGLVNSYAEPERMGVDRWLAMLAASQRCPHRFCVIDAGSALTIDFVDGDGQHEGGYIIPGAALMQRALIADTDRVRFDASSAPTLAPGQSTAEAVANGLLLAQVGAVRLGLEQARARGPEPELFLCGGGAPALRDALDAPVREVPDIVLDGLRVQAEIEGVLA